MLRGTGNNNNNFLFLALRTYTPEGIKKIIINDIVYGAVIVTMVTARVHPVHLMNAD